MIDIYKIFKEYVDNYDYNNEGVAMKYSHSLRVSKIASKIASSLNLNNDDILLSEKCGLLHDIARFKQITEYKTFTDHKSFDHGDMGEVILRENDYINKYETNKEKKELILKTVRNHNKLEIEKNFDDKTNLFCKIIRDADKVDILLTQSIYEIKGDYSINENIYNAFKNNVMVKNKDVISEADNMLRQVAFIFDLKFNESFKLIKESDPFKKIFEYLKSNVDSKYIDDIEKIVYDYIDSRMEKNR